MSERELYLHKDECRMVKRLKKAMIIENKCIACGLCLEHCRFNAIDHQDDYRVNPYKCEGCKVCKIVCPVDAIEMVESIDGSVDLYGQNQIFSTGRLKIGSGNSGLLVTEVKKQLNGLTSVNSSFLKIGCNK